MTQKIQKLTNEIDRTRTKINDLQSRLREMEQQRTELENTEIVALFRSLDVSPDKLPGFISGMKGSASLPETVSQPEVPARQNTSMADFQYTPNLTRNEEENENEG